MCRYCVEYEDINNIVQFNIEISFSTLTIEITFKAFKRSEIFSFIIWHNKFVGSKDFSRLKIISESDHHRVLPLLDISVSSMLGMEESFDLTSCGMFAWLNCCHCPPVAVGQNSTVSDCDLNTRQEPS